MIFDLWLIILILIVGFFYIISMQGITCCNSGSMFALTRAIVDKKKLSINEFMKYTKHRDYAKIKNKCYTDRPPGLSFAAVPVYWLGGNVTLVSVISGVLASIMVYLITMQLVSNPIISFFVGLIFAFSTLNWRYSTMFFIHPLSTFLVLLAVYGLFVGFPFLLIGLILGLASIVEYTNLIFLLGIGLSETILGNFWSTPYLAIGYFIGIFPLLIYNTKCFGSPFTTSYKHSVYFKWSNSPRTTFVTPMYKGIWGLLFHVKKKEGVRLPGGILLVSPVLIFGIIGFFFMPYSILILFLSLTLPLYLLISKHKTYWAGGSGDYRYLSSIIPFITIPIGLTLINLSFLWLLVLILALISLMMVILRIVTLTASIEDLKRIKKRKSRLLSLLIEGLFIRKVKIEDVLKRKLRDEERGEERFLN